MMMKWNHQNQNDNNPEHVIKNVGCDTIIENVENVLLVVRHQKQQEQNQSTVSSLLNVLNHERQKNREKIYRIRQHRERMQQQEQKLQLQEQQCKMQPLQQEQKDDDDDDNDNDNEYRKKNCFVVTQEVVDNKDDGTILDFYADVHTTLDFHGYGESLAKESTCTETNVVGIITNKYDPSDCLTISCDSKYNNFNDTNTITTCTLPTASTSIARIAASESENENENNNTPLFECDRDMTTISTNPSMIQEKLNQSHNPLLLSTNATTTRYPSLNKQDSLSTTATAAAASTTTITDTATETDLQDCTNMTAVSTSHETDNKNGDRNEQVVLNSCHCSSSSTSNSRNNSFGNSGSSSGSSSKRFQTRTDMSWKPWRGERNFGRIHERYRQNKRATLLNKENHINRTTIMTVDYVMTEQTLRNDKDGIIGCYVSPSSLLKTKDSVDVKIENRDDENYVNADSKDDKYGERLVWVHNDINYDSGNNLYPYNGHEAPNSCTDIDASKVVSVSNNAQMESSQQQQRTMSDPNQFSNNDNHNDHLLNFIPCKVMTNNVNNNGKPTTTFSNLKNGCNLSIFDFSTTTSSEMRDAQTRTIFNGSSINEMEEKGQIIQEMNDDNCVTPVSLPMNRMMIHHHNHKCSNCDCCEILSKNIDSKNSTIAATEKNDCMDGPVNIEDNEATECIKISPNDKEMWMQILQLLSTSETETETENNTNKSNSTNNSCTSAAALSLLVELCPIHTSSKHYIINNNNKNSNNKHKNSSSSVVFTIRSAKLLSTDGKINTNE